MKPITLIKLTEMLSVATIVFFSSLLEASLQAQVLVPLVVSVVFGMISATFLTLLVLPASYSILEDMGFVEVAENGSG